VPSTSRLLAYIGIGLVAGFASGLFGVGGGILIVPALVILMKFDQKAASGTSLLAVAPISVAGTIVYAAADDIDWIVSLLLAIGMVAGGAVGALLLHKVHTLVVSWLFILVLVGIAVRMLFVAPARGEEVPIGVVTAIVLIVLGFVVGALSGLVGLGGGVVIVPTLVVLFGMDDLIAKGASLVSLVPSALSTSVLNLRRRNGDLVAGLAIGIAGALTTWPGMLLAEFLDGRIASILFAILLLGVAAQLVVRTVRQHRAREGLDAGGV